MAAHVSRSKLHPFYTGSDAMARATIPKPVLDSLIRAKLADLRRCAEIKPLPVSWVPNGGNGCNWTIPGWTGDARQVEECTEQIGPYIDLLRSQFNIPEERSPRSER